MHIKKSKIKTQLFSILGALNFANLINFRLSKVQKCIKIETQTLDLPVSPELILREINFGELKKYQFRLFRGSEFLNWVNFSLQKNEAKLKFITLLF